MNPYKTFTTEELTRILRMHDVPAIVTPDGRVLADTMRAGTKRFEETVDVTDYTQQQLKDWLGY